MNADTRQRCRTHEAGPTRPQAESGIVLILSLLLLGVITAVGLGISLLVINEVKQTVRVDESIVATYAAEAKVEEALSVVKRNRLNGSTLNGTVAEIQGLGGTVAVGPNTASVDLDTTSSGENMLLLELAKDQSVQFAVQTDACFSNPGDPSCIKSITFSGVTADAAAPPPWIELSEFAFSPFTGETTVLKELVADTEFDPATPKLYAFLGDAPATVPTDVQAIRLKALFNGVKNLEIRAYTDSSGTAPADILGRININSLGTFGNSEIGVSASVPWNLPTSGLFDYVIFSEETVAQK